MVNMLEIRSRQCRWIDGDDMECCGNSTEIAQSWCSEHLKRVFTKTPGTADDRMKAQFASRNSGSQRQFG